MLYRYDTINIWLLLNVVFTSMASGRQKSVGEYGFRFADPKHREEYEIANLESNESTRSGSTKRLSSLVSASPDKKRGRHDSTLPFGRKEVIQFDLTTGALLNVFDSGSHASRCLGICQTKISQCCRGKVQNSDYFSRVKSYCAQE